MLFIIIFLLVVASPFLVWGIWTWKTFRRKNLRLFYFQLIFFLIGLFVMTWWLRVFPGSSWYYERERYKALTGKLFTADEVYVHESPRAFNGDGYSIWVYELDEKTASTFTMPNNEFFKFYPKKSDSRQDWGTRTWQRTPLQPEEDKFRSFALSDFLPEDKDKAKKLKETFAYLEKVLNEEGSYYAYNYYLHDEGIVSNIDFYILIPKDRRLVVINSNT
jgi:hypothetical protein